MNTKECLHDFISVYYGNEWQVECSKCNGDIWKIYSKDDANVIIDKMLEINKNQ